MPHYYFHLYEGDKSTSDDVGLIRPDVDAARIEAVITARGIISAEASNGRVDLTPRIDVKDRAGAAIFTLLFSDAVELVTA